MSRKLALVIGNSEYQDPKLARLVKPGKDALGLAHVLRDSGLGGFDEVTTLVDELDARLRRAITRFCAQKQRDDLLLLYFSGHGILDEEGLLYFAARDTEHDALIATAIPAGFVGQAMNRSASRRQVLILDCCHSGAFGRGAKSGPGLNVSTAAVFEVTGYGRTLLTATDAIQYAWENEEFVGEAEHSVFTHYLIEGLRTGAADNEGDGDGLVSLVELYDFVHARVKSATPRQTPTRSVDSQAGPIYIARNPNVKVRPVELSAELKKTMEDPLAWVREGVVRELERIARGSHAVLHCMLPVAHLIAKGRPQNPASTLTGKFLLCRSTCTLVYCAERDKNLSLLCTGLTSDSVQTESNAWRFRGSSRPRPTVGFRSAQTGNSVSINVALIAQYGGATDDQTGTTKLSLDLVISICTRVQSPTGAELRPELFRRLYSAAPARPGLRADRRKQLRQHRQRPARL